MIRHTHHIAIDKHYFSDGTLNFIRVISFDENSDYIGSKMYHNICNEYVLANGFDGFDHSSIVKIHKYF